MIRDLEIEEICTAECRVIYLSCRDDCVDQSCDAQCSSEYTLCLNNCPCSINCPDGCAGCDYYLCENSTERIWKNFQEYFYFFFIIPSKSRRLQHRQQRMILLRMSKLSAILSDTLALLTFSTLKDSRRTDASKRRQEEQAVITTWITQR